MFYKIDLPTKDEVYSLVQGIRPKALTIELQKEYFENFSG
jgi:hypothetical protein